MSTPAKQAWNEYMLLIIKSALFVVSFDSVSTSFCHNSLLTCIILSRPVGVGLLTVVAFGVVVTNIPSFTLVLVREHSPVIQMILILMFPRLFWSGVSMQYFVKCCSLCCL